MLEDVKEALRVSGDDLDIEIKDLIAAAKADLLISGVHESNIIDADPLIKRAIITYVKANFGYEDVRMSERFEEVYINLKQHLSLAQKSEQVIEDGEGLQTQVKVYPTLGKLRSIRRPY